MFKVHTLNSIYEVNSDAKLIRRLEGDHPATDRFSPDGEWKPYTSISGIVRIGESMVVHWPNGQPKLRDLTITSTVLGIETPWLDMPVENNETSPT